MTTHKSHKEQLPSMFEPISFESKQAHPQPRPKQSVKHLPRSVKWSL